MRTLTPMRLRARLRQAVYERQGAVLNRVAVDYLQLMQSDGKHDNRAAELEEITRELKLLAQEFDCCIIAASALNRGSVSGGKDRRPGLHDLRGSGSIEADADNVWFVHRDDAFRTDGFDGEAEWIIGKGRNCGTGTVDLKFERWCSRFVPGAGADEPPEERRYADP